ncbi:MAG: hypothetical protein IJA20_03075 [Methanocorpusculum sp.]|nr:hypothetical protein [Methanocorpusculum sp.]
MKIKTQTRCRGNRPTRVTNTYTHFSICDRESSMRWAVSASEKLSLECKSIDIEDGLSYHDGSIAMNGITLEGADDFVKKYFDTAVYSMMISGNFNGSFVTVQIDFTGKFIHISADETAQPQIEEIEQLLDLV